MSITLYLLSQIDSIIDTVGVVAALDLLGIDEVYCSALPMSSGTVW